MRSSAAQKWAARLAVCGLAVVGVQLAGTAIASAHTNDVSGVASCAVDGSITVTWTLHNTWASPDSVSLNSWSPTAQKPAPDTLTLATTGTAGDRGTMVQSNIPAGTATATIDVKGYWAADNTTVASTVGSLTLTGTCPTPPPPPASHVATTPSFDNGACVAGKVTQPAITIPNDRGVNYTLDSKPTAAGTYVVTPEAHHVVATSTTYTLTGTTAWTLTPTAAASNCSISIPLVAPNVVQSSCVGSSPTTPTLTLPKTADITYTVSAKGPYHQGQSVVVTATASPGHSWLAPLPTGWDASSSTTAKTTIVFAETGPCTEAATVVKPGFSSAQCTESTPVTAGSYTIPATKGISYQVSGKTVTAGTYTAPWGSTVTVVAVAKSGFTVHGRTVFTSTFPTKAKCSDLAGETSTTVPQSTDSGTGSNGATPTLASTGAPTGSLLIGGLGAIVLGAMFLVLGSRRRQDDAV